MPQNGEHKQGVNISEPSAFLSHLFRMINGTICIGGNTRNSAMLETKITKCSKTTELLIVTENWAMQFIKVSF